MSVSISKCTSFKFCSSLFKEISSFVNQYFNRWVSKRTGTVNTLYRNYSLLFDFSVLIFISKVVPRRTRTWINMAEIINVLFSRLAAEEAEGTTFFLAPMTVRTSPKWYARLQPRITRLIYKHFSVSYNSLLSAECNP